MTYPTPSVLQLSRVLNSVGDLIGRIRDDQWSASTPCTGLCVTWSTTWRSSLFSAVPCARARPFSSALSRRSCARGGIVVTSGLELDFAQGVHAAGGRRLDAPATHPLAAADLV